MLFARRKRAPAPVELPRDEMAFRKQYQRLLVARKITTVFRPGDRRFPAWRGYAVGETVTARVIARVGSDALGIPPRFNDLRAPIQITEVRLIDVDALAPADFEGSSPDVFDRRSLLTHLEVIYGRPITAFGSVVTRIAFAYCEAGVRKAPEGADCAGA
jgi:hypothetical protein